MALIEELMTPAQRAAAAQAANPPTKQDVAWPDEVPEDAAILKQVTQDHFTAQHYVYTRGWPSEWLRYERLYLFQVPIQMWEGTEIPRAHLGVPLVYEHIESILPQVMLGLFGDTPPFSSRPFPGTSMEAARANDQLLQWELLKSDFREGIRRLVKHAAIYGTGIGKWGWKREKKTRTVFRRPSDEPANVQLPVESSPLFGPQMRKNVDAKPVPVEEEYEVNHPTFEAIHIRHVLVDPGLRTPDIQNAKYAMHIMYWTPLELDALRNDPTYTIPSREKLVELALPPKEQPKQGPLETNPLDIGTDFMPAFYLWGYRATPRPMDTSIDPLQQPLEVIEYWTKDHVYTVLQRKLVIRKAANPFKMLPFCALVYSDLPDSFYGIGISKLIGGEQRLQQGVLNSFLDELSLSLNTPFVRVRGANVPTAQLRLHPGGVIDTDNPEGIGLLQRQPLPVEVFSVLAASDARAQRRDAANEMAVQGAMPSEKSSITRTATGVNALTGGSGARLQYLIENIAYFVFVPTLQAFHRMNALYLEPEQISDILTNELGLAYKGDPEDLINGRYDFDILAGARLQSKRALTQMLPLMFQFLLTEPVMNGLQTEGKKVNIEELVNMLFDAANAPNRSSVIVGMTPEDESRAAMNNPAMQQIVAQQAIGQQKQQQVESTIDAQNTARAGREILRELMRRIEGPAVGFQGGGQ